MKRLIIIILFLIPTMLFAGGNKEKGVTADTVITEKPEIMSVDASELSQEELIAALEESNDLLEQAYDLISKKQKKIDEQKMFIDSLNIELAACSAALANSNEVLEEAYNRIEDDQKEINSLREHIKRLVDAGIEVKTPSWDVTVLTGYPAIIGTQIGYNFPFLPQLGVTTGALYSFEHESPYIIAGVKLNLDIQ